MWIGTATTIAAWPSQTRSPPSPPRADQVHAAAPRARRTSRQHAHRIIVVNLRLLGLIERGLSRTKRNPKPSPSAPTRDPAKLSSRRPRHIPRRHRVHAAAIVKAYKKGNQGAGQPPSTAAFPRSLFSALEQIIEIGPLSGRSNVIYWLEKRSIAPNDDLVDHIFVRRKTDRAHHDRTRNPERSSPRPQLQPRHGKSDHGAKRHRTAHPANQVTRSSRTESRAFSFPSRPAVA